MKRRLAAACIVASCLAGMALTLYGLANMHWRDARAFSDIGLVRYILFLTICSFAVLKTANRTRRDPMTVGCLIAAGIALLVGDIWPLLAALWFGLASLVLGKAILSTLKIGHRGAGWSLSFLTGAGTYGTAVGLLAHFPVNFPEIYGVALAAPLVLARHSLSELDLVGTLRRGINLSAPGAPVSGLDVAIVVVALVHFCVSLLPDIGYDALAVHLFTAAHLSLRHQWEFDVTHYAWAVMPMLGDWIFSIGYMLAGETAARLINVGFIFILGWLVYRIVMWAGGSSRGGKWASLIFLCTPLTYTESSSLLIESIWAAFAVTGTLETLKLCFPAEKEKSDLRNVSLLIGFALAAKAVTLTMMPALLLLMAFRFKAWLNATSYAMLAAALGLAACAGLVPYVTAYWMTGNPVFPFFNALFRSPYYPALNFQAPAVFDKGVSWNLLYRITFDSRKFLESRAGAAGFQWLLLFIPAAVSLIALRHRRGLTIISIAVLCTAITFQSSAYLRYAFPFFVLMTASIGIALSTWEHPDNPFPYRAMVSIAGATVFLNMLFLSAASEYREFPIDAARSGGAREAFLTHRFPIRTATQIVNMLNVDNAPVAVFSEPRIAGLQADVLYPLWYNHQFQFQINACSTKDAMGDVLSSRGVKFVILDASWGTFQKRALIMGATESLAELGAISIRTVRSQYRSHPNKISPFQLELIGNPDFRKMENWTSAGAIKRTPDGILASVESPLFQSVPVAPGQRYLNAVKARCGDQPAQGRIQVNWLDSELRFISTEIRTFECSVSATEHSMEVTAPKEAGFAVVYASGNTSVPLIFEQVSFRR